MLVLPWFADSLMLLTSFFAFDGTARGVVTEDEGLRMECGGWGRRTRYGEVTV